MGEELLDESRLKGLSNGEGRYMRQVDVSEEEGWTCHGRGLGVVCEVVFWIDGEARREARLGVLRYGSECIAGGELSPRCPDFDTHLAQLHQLHVLCSQIVT